MGHLESGPVAAAKFVAFHGLRIEDALHHRDGRGSLSVLEHGRDMGFVASRTFFIDFADDAPRAEHAPSCTQLLVVLQGALRIELDNGEAQAVVEARSFRPFLLVAGGVWRRLVPLEPGTRLMVLANASYADTTYSDAARPDLIAELTGHVKV